MLSKAKNAGLWIWSVIKSFNSSRCSMHAAGLTYYVLLAIIPILCVLLTIAKSVGLDEMARNKIHEWFETQVTQFEVSAGLKAEEQAKEDAAEVAKVEDEGEAADMAEVQAGAAAATRAATAEFISQAREIERSLLDKIAGFNVGTLGWIGFAMLVWTVISSIGMIEISFNEIWNVPKERPIWKRALLDLFVALMMPVLMSLAVSAPLLKIAKDVIVATAGSLWLTKWVSDGAVWLLDSWLVRTSITVFFATLVFAFLFKVMPNCRVRGKPAMWAGLFTALAFGGWMKLCAVAQVGIAKSSALYGSFAFMPIVLAWIYVSWQIILLGCCMVSKSSQSGDN